MTSNNTVRDLLAAVVVMVFLITTAVTLTLLCKPLYYHDMKTYHLAEQSGYPEEMIRENYEALIDYNVSPLIKELHFSGLAMSEEGRIHFKEVKAIFQWVIRLCLLSGALTAGIAYAMYRARSSRYLTIAGILTLTLPVILTLLIAADWERVFLLFHELAFANDYWLFDPATDPIIDLLPDIFFMHSAILIVILILTGALGCIVLGQKLKQKAKKSNLS